MAAPGQQRFHARRPKQRLSAGRFRHSRHPWIPYFAYRDSIIIPFLHEIPAMPETAKSLSPSSGHSMASRLSLAAKLYSIFALFALLTAAITVLSDYNTRRNSELTEAIETASRAAPNVERVNALVYAVVMESRGVYMSTEAAAVKKFGDG